MIIYVTFSCSIALAFFFFSILLPFSKAEQVKYIFYYLFQLHVEIKLL